MLTLLTWQTDLLWILCLFAVPERWPWAAVRDKIFTHSFLKAYSVGCRKTRAHSALPTSPKTYKLLYFSWICQYLNSTILNKTYLHFLAKSLKLCSCYTAFNNFNIFLFGTIIFRLFLFYLPQKPPILSLVPEGRVPMSRLSWLILNILPAALRLFVRTLLKFSTWDWNP